ncbi:MAG: hypothetical protein V7647_684 [Acidobacteriota bacterium]|jgi:hypothetical protein
MDDKTKGIGVERTSGRSDEYISGREALDTDGRIGERGTSRIPSRTNTGTSGAGAGTSSDTTRNLSTSSSSMDAPTEERTREIRAEIEQTRGELSETVNAIQDRLRPGNIASNAAESVKSTVKSVASDKAQYVADTAREMADSEPVQYVRANPIPTAMIGIGIAGLTWLALGGREAQSRNRNRYRTAGRTSRDWRRLAPYDEGDRYYRGGTGHTGYTGQSGYSAESGFGDAGFGEAGYPGQGGYETAAAYNPDQDLNTGVRSGYSGTRGSYGTGSSGTGSYDTSRAEYGDRSSSWTDEASQTAQDLGRRAQQTTRVAQRKLQQTWQQNPLLMGAASAVLGLIVGMAVPETDIENEYMGEARDQAFENVQQTVRETVGKVQEVATNAVQAVTGEQKPAGGQQAGGTQGQQSNPSATAASQSNPASSQTSRPNQPGSQGQSGSQSQQSGGSGQPPKNPGVI